MLFSFWILYLYIRNILELKGGKKNIKHAYSFQGIMDIATVAMVITCFALIHKLDYDEEEIFKDDAFYDFNNIITLYQDYHILNALTTLLILIRFLFFLTIIKKIYITISVIQMAAKNVVAFMIILVPFLSGFSMIAMVLWGPNINMF